MSYSGKYPMHEEQARRKAEREDAAREPEPILANLGPVEVVMNDQRYVREETLFAAMHEVERLRAALANIGREDRLLSPSTLRKLAREALDG